MIIPYPCVSLTSDAAATMKIRTDFAAGCPVTQKGHASVEVIVQVAGSRVLRVEGVVVAATGVA